MSKSGEGDLKHSKGDFVGLSAQLNTGKHNYRPDIDGLRALAVLAVVFFHIDESIVPGGFVGVDIFFVISGFLITGIITKSKEDDHFSLSQFYLRRVKRIIPALTVVLLAVLFVGQLLLLPEDFARLSLTALAGEFFFANIYFTYFLDISYFANDSSLEPLLHLWSLGVEEQFYLFWPLLLVGLLGRFGRSGVLFFAIAASVVSFLLGELILVFDPMFSYYMLPTRAGELLAGAIVFFVVSANFRLVHLDVPRQLLALFGLTLIAYSLFVLSGDKTFPGLNAIPVTLGTSLIIWSGSTGATFLSRILTYRLFVGVGLISYSMYLWHWPVLAFQRYLDPNLSFESKVFSFFAIVILSVLSFRYVETPCRQSRGSFSREMLKTFVFPSALILSTCLLVLYTNGYAFHLIQSGYKLELAGKQDNFQQSWKYRYICQRPRLESSDLSKLDCAIGGAEEPAMILWGDSNASYYVGILGELADELGFSFRNAAHSSCPPLLDFPERFVPDDLKADCRHSSAVVKDTLERYETVVLVGDWGTYLAKGNAESFSDALADTVSHLIRVGKRVVLLGRVPVIKSFDRECYLKKIKLPSLDCEDRMRVGRSAVDEVNAAIEGIAVSSGAHYYDVVDILCGPEECSAALGGVPVYHDPGHLSLVGATHVGREARTQGLARSVFSAVSEKLSAPSTRPLPWHQGWVPRESVLRSGERVLLVDSARLTERRAWSGSLPAKGSYGEPLVFSDAVSDSYQASTATVSIDAEALSGEKGRVSYVEVALIIEGGSNSFPLFRVKGSSGNSEQYDVLVDTALGAGVSRGAGVDKYFAVHQIDRDLLVKIQVPVEMVEHGMRLIVFPAASYDGLSYSEGPVGAVSIRNIEVYGLVEDSI